MATINSRLDQIENALSPKQVILNWLEKAQAFESLDEHCRWLAEHNEEDLPLALLARQMRTSIEKRCHGQDPKKIQTAIRGAVREVLFLFYLFRAVIRENTCHTRSIALLGEFSAEGASSALRESENITDLNDLDRFSTDQRYFRSYASEVFGLKATIKHIQDKYFDGHQILWRYQTRILDRHTVLINEIAASWSLVFRNLAGTQKKGKQGRKGSKLRDLDLDLDELQRSIDPIERSKEIVDSAKAQALAAIGETNRALDFMRPWLRPRA